MNFVGCTWQGHAQHCPAQEPLSAQTVPVKALRIPSSSTNQSRDTSKADLGSTQNGSSMWSFGKLKS